ncbi:hypothetical protein [Aurantimonas sp. 22II-16-19i]|uniref:phage baseplate assembly protein n=1 Tax=Aurantimonas sp. 22II-16-19i TaxID=1317114 RepID=UPI0009F7D82F|nr:hypothetical protein [Aurantimonas sp. 22II-16-19i]ORE91006.1 Mu P family protein [Aurantimonas sp. 22II-16-19i]
MAWETVVLEVAGKPLAFTRVELRVSAEEVSREASFDIVWVQPGPPCGPDEEAKITVSGELWLTGYTRDVRGSLSTDRRSYALTVVSKSVDATEASVDHPTGLAKDLDLKGIAETFDTLGIGIESTIKTAKKKLHKLRIGETLFQTLETDARALGVLIHDTAEGKLKLSKGPDGKVAGALREGVNIEQASATISGRGTFSEIKVRGQASEGTSKTALRPVGEASAGGKRKRPLIKVHEGEATSERLKDRAAWEAKRAAGSAKECTVTTPGWRSNGQLFEANKTIETIIPAFGIEQQMTIASIVFEQEASDGQGGGTKATLTLKDPRALGGENPRGKSADSWSAPAVPIPTFRAD